MAWSRGTSTDMLGTTPRNNASAQSAALLDRVVIPLHATTLAQMGEGTGRAPGTKGGGDPMEGQTQDVPAV
eukprot:10881837-Prorocentrum_lima.AAC.1